MCLPKMIAIKINASFGKWKGKEVRVLRSYLNGTSECNIVCHDDIAVISLAPKNGEYVGKRTGWFGSAYGGWGFSTFLGRTMTQITQLGYPNGLDNGGVMERTDSLGFVMTPKGWFSNTIIGSREDGGSSGGSWLLNFGLPPKDTGARVAFGAN
jgi:hypothetical protein